MRATLQSRCPDVLLTDISLPDGDIVDFCHEVLEDFPAVKIIVLTVHDEYSVIKRMLDIGVHGYLLKSSSSSELVDAIERVWKDEHYVSAEVSDILSKSAPVEVSLTAVETKVLRLICDGFTNPQIAGKLCLGVETINWYRKRLLAKFNVNNSVSLVRRVLTEHII